MRLMFGLKGGNRKNVATRRIQSGGRPVSPGEVLRDELLKARGVTQEDLARAIGMSRITINQLINGKRSITAETALKLSRALGTTAVFWLNLQRAVDLFDAEKKLDGMLDKISQIHS